jgi:hypothetical protein
MNKFMVFLCPISHVKLACKWRWGIKNSATAEGFLREGNLTPGYPSRPQYTFLKWCGPKTGNLVCDLGGRGLGVA